MIAYTTGCCGQDTLEALQTHLEEYLDMVINALDPVSYTGCAFYMYMRIRILTSCLTLAPGNKERSILEVTLIPVEPVMDGTGQVHAWKSVPHPHLSHATTMPGSQVYSRSV